MTTSKFASRPGSRSNASCTVARTLCRDDSQPPALRPQPRQYLDDLPERFELLVERLVVAAVCRDEVVDAIRIERPHLRRQPGPADGGREHLFRECRARARSSRRASSRRGSSAPSRSACRRDRTGRRESAPPDRMQRLVLDAHEVEAPGWRSRPCLRPRRDPPAAARCRPGCRSSIVPTSVRTIWRRNESAVISKSRCSPRSCQDAESTVRRKTSCWVSVGVNARKSCSPTQEVGGGGERVEIDPAGVPPASANLERRPLPPTVDAIAIAARAGGVPRMEVGRSLLRSHGRDVVGQQRVQRFGRALDGRPAAHVGADDVAERVDARVRAAGHGDVLRDGEERP